MATKKKAKKAAKAAAPVKRWQDVEPRIDHPVGFRTVKVVNESGKIAYRHEAL